MVNSALIQFDLSFKLGPIWGDFRQYADWNLYHPIENGESNWSPINLASV